MTADQSRRLFLRHSVAAVIALPGLAMAQAPGGMRRVALLLATSPAATSHAVKALVDGLAKLGWVEGRNLRLDIRYAEGDVSRYRPLAAELLGQRPDIFVAGADQVAREASALTKSVPIVFAIGFDPVGTGVVQSLA
jgi:putative ABC transport system substrate-binding protein